MVSLFFVISTVIELTIVVFLKRILEWKSNRTEGFGVGEVLLFALVDEAQPTFKFFFWDSRLDVFETTVKILCDEGQRNFSAVLDVLAGESVVVGRRVQLEARHQSPCLFQGHSR